MLSFPTKSKKKLNVGFLKLLKYKKLNNKSNVVFYLIACSHKFIVLNRNCNKITVGSYCGMVVIVPKKLI